MKIRKDFGPGATGPSNTKTRKKPKVYPETPAGAGP